MFSTPPSFFASDAMKRLHVVKIAMGAPSRKACIITRRSTRMIQAVEARGEISTLGDGEVLGKCGAKLWFDRGKMARIGAVAAFVILSAPKAASATRYAGSIKDAGTSLISSSRGQQEICQLADASVVDAPAEPEVDPLDDIDNGDVDTSLTSAEVSKRRRRRRSVTKKKVKQINLSDYEVGDSVRGNKRSKLRVQDVRAIEALELVQYKTGEHPESAKQQLSKAEKVYSDLSKEYELYQAEQANPLKKFFSKRGERFTRNVNLAYLRDPFAKMGTEQCPTETSYTAFHKLVDVGRVNRVVYLANETSIRYYIDDTKEVFMCHLPYDPMLYKRLIMERPGDAGFIDIEMEQYPGWLSVLRFCFNTLTPLVLVYYAWIIYEDTFKDSSEDMFGNMTTRTYDSRVRQGMSLADISGIDTVKEEMLELISYLKDFERYNSMGARIPAGVLLCGPPGTGKTLLARCVAGEANVPFFSCAGTEFMEMFVGVGAARIRNLFDQAKKVAPCIIFIDEFDAVGTKRSETQSGQVYGNDEATATINQMLTEMDGFSTSTGVMILAATNRPQVLDPALIRAGRFDRVIEMGLPNKGAREEILRLHCNKSAFQMSVDPNLDYDYISSQCAGFSGADIENLTKSAVMRIVQAERGVANTGDFLWCIDDIRRSQTFVRAGSGAGSLSRDKTLEDSLVQKLNPYVRDTISTYYAAQTVVAMQMPAYDELSKVAVFVGGKAMGQISYVPDEVDSPAARSVRSQTYYG
jgi:cell division protease FtsH